MNLEWESLNQQLRERFPVLREDRYAKLAGHTWSEPYFVFGIVFNRYLLDIAEEDDSKAKLDASAFIEEMAVAEDGYVIDMIVSEVLPSLVKNQNMLDSYWPLLGPATRRWLRLLPPRFTAGVELPQD